MVSHFRSISFPLLSTLFLILFIPQMLSALFLTLSLPKKIEREVLLKIRFFLPSSSCLRASRLPRRWLLDVIFICPFSFFPKSFVIDNIIRIYRFFVTDSDEFLLQTHFICFFLHSRDFFVSVWSKKRKS